MRVALQLLRWMFWVEFCLMTFSGFSLVRGNLLQDRLTDLLTSLFFLYSVALALSTLLAAWSMTWGFGWARGMAITASLLHLPYIPVFTFQGLVGCLLLLLPSAKHELRQMAIDEKLMRPSTQGRWMQVFDLLQQPLFLSISISLFLAPVLRDWVARGGFPAPTALQAMALVGGGLFLSMVTHEFGHLIAGLMLRQRLAHLHLPGVRLRRLVEGWEWSAHPAWLLSVGVDLEPTQTKHFRTDRMLVAAAGPTANLLATVVWSALHIWSLEDPWAREQLPLLPWFSFVQVLVEWTSALYNLLPLERHGAFTDGARILQLWRNDSIGQRWLALSSFQISASSQVRPSQWDETFVEAACALQDGSPEEAVAQLSAYVCHIDAGRIDRARQHLLRALSIAAQHQESFDYAGACYEAAWFAACHDRDLAKAHYWIQRAEGKRPLERIDELQALCGMSLREGNYRETARMSAEAIGLLNSTEAAGHQLMLCERFTVMETEANEALSAQLSQLQAHNHKVTGQASRPLHS
jgi:hypothetical protein